MTPPAAVRARVAPPLAIHQDGASVRIDVLHYDTAEGTKFSPGDEPRRTEGGGEALLPSHGTTACGATGGEEALLPIRGTAARAFERTVRTRV